MSSPTEFVAAREKASARNYVITATLVLGAIAGSMNNAVISTTLGQPTFLEYFGFLELNGENTSLIGAALRVFFTGSLFGLYYQSYIADKYGRRASLASAAVTSIVSGALLAGSVHIAMFLVFRFVSGFGASQFVSTVPMMMSEMSPPRHRGFIVGMFGLGLSIGYSMTSWIGVGFYFVQASGAQWRIPYAITTVPSLAILCLLPWIPESPRWLLMHDRAEEAAQIIRSLHGSQQDSELDRFASLEFDQMKEQLIFELQNQITWVEFLTSKRYARRVWTAALTMMASQSAGILVVVSYSAVITRSLGFGPVTQLCITASYLTIGMPCTLAGALMVDRFGRLRMIITGTLVEVVIISCLTAIIAKYVGTTNNAANSAAIALFFLYFVAYTTLVEGQIYTYVTELFPSHLRAKGVTWGISWLYLLCIPFTTGALYAFDTIGWRYYLVFIIVPLAVVTALGIIGRETKGKTLEEIGAVFGDELVVRTLTQEIQGDKPDAESVHVEKLETTTTTTEN